MKKNLIIVLIMLFAFVGIAEATGGPPSVNEVVSVVVIVSEYFSLIVTPTSIDFGTLAPEGISTVQTINIVGSSNQGNAFWIKQQATADLIWGTEVIDITNVEYTVTKNSGNGTIFPGIGNLEVLLWRPIYGSETLPKTDGDVDVNYTLTVPKNTIAGIYTTTFIINMTE